MDINEYLARKAAVVDGAFPGFINGLKTARPKLKEAMLGFGEQPDRKLAEGNSKALLKRLLRTS
ncbi:MAG: hypothetical protein V1913_11055 [Fibrobacterota bacterium]